MTREIDGNPTATAWAFVAVAQTDGAPFGEINPGAHDGTHDGTGVYCVVPLPPGF